MSAERSGKHLTIPAGCSIRRENTIRAKETQMSDNKRFRGWWCAVASAALLAVSAAIAPPASAQDTGPQVSSDAVQSRDLSSAPEVPTVAAPAGLAINRPTIPMADYVAAKNAAAAKAPGKAKPGGAPPSSSDVTLFAQVASTNENQSCCLPPDGDVATSASWMVQVNNDVITMLNWNTNAFVQKKFSTFFGNSTDFIFDPRVIWDPYWNRFVVLADGCVFSSGCETSTNVSVFELAISTSSDPTGGWFIYRFGPGTGTGDFADFPQLGMDLNSIILTYNDFQLGGGFDARTAAIAKSYLYNGFGFSVPLFGGSGCTMAPPYVLDNSGVDYVITICPGGNVVWIASLKDTGLSTVSMHLWDNVVSVGNFGIPPQAVQPAPNAGYTLDTGDNRFENRSLQVGSRLLNTATVNLVGYPSPSWYNFNIGASPPVLLGEGYFFASPTSYDWHPAINANRVAAPAGTPLGEIFTTWMSTDTTVNVQLRAGGGLGDSPSSGSGIPVFTSSFGLTNQTDLNGTHRTGDYAYIATYPAAALGCGATELGILEGETVGPSAGLWGTHIAIVKHC
jgi:hypothetical protein